VRRIIEAGIGACLRIGYTRVAAARRRLEAHLRRDPALRQRLQQAAMIYN
jgi:hypothetical protein